MGSITGKILPELHNLSLSFSVLFLTTSGVLVSHCTHFRNKQNVNNEIKTKCEKNESENKKGKLES